MPRKAKTGRKARDWTGHRCNHLYIIGRGPVNTETADRHSLWVGLCDCGNRRLVRSNELNKGHAKHCGDKNCPCRKATSAHLVVQRGEYVNLSDTDLKEALNNPCRLCHTPYAPGHVLGLYNPKLGYVKGNTFTLCFKCRGLQPLKRLKGKAVTFEQLINHICKLLNHLMDTGDIKLGAASENT